METGGVLVVGVQIHVIFAITADALPAVADTQVLIEHVLSTAPVVGALKTGDRKAGGVGQQGGAMGADELDVPILALGV